PNGRIQPAIHPRPKLRRGRLCASDRGVPRPLAVRPDALARQPCAVYREQHVLVARAVGRALRIGPGLSKYSTFAWRLFPRASTGVYRLKIAERDSATGSGLQASGRALFLPVVRSL